MSNFNQALEYWLVNTGEERPPTLSDRLILTREWDGIDETQANIFIEITKN